MKVDELTTATETSDRKFDEFLASLTDKELNFLLHNVVSTDTTSKAAAQPTTMTDTSG